MRLLHAKTPNTRERQERIDRASASAYFTDVRDETDEDTAHWTGGAGLLIFQLASYAARPCWMHGHQTSSMRPAGSAGSPSRQEAATSAGPSFVLLLARDVDLPAAAAPATPAAVI